MLLDLREVHLTQTWNGRDNQEKLLGGLHTVPSLGQSPCLNPPALCCVLNRLSLALLYFLSGATPLFHCSQLYLIHSFPDIGNTVIITPQQCLSHDRLKI